MPRPQFITEDQIKNWDQKLDPQTSKWALTPALKELCYAGFYLSEKLKEENCPDELIARIQYTAGQLSFGKDAWDIHIEILENYYNQTLIIEN